MLLNLSNSWFKSWYHQFALPLVQNIFRIFLNVLHLKNCPMIIKTVLWYKFCWYWRREKSISLMKDGTWVGFASGRSLTSASKPVPEKSQPVCMMGFVLLVVATGWPWMSPGTLATGCFIAEIVCVLTQSSCCTEAKNPEDGVQPTEMLMGSRGSKKRISSQKTLFLGNLRD